MTAADLEQLRAEVDDLREHTNAMFRVAGIFYEAGWNDAPRQRPAGWPLPGRWQDIKPADRRTSS